MMQRPEMEAGMRMEVTLETWVKGAMGLGAMLWAQTPPLVQLLLILMCTDMATGLLAAVVNREVSSSVTFRGVCKKAIVLLMVGAGVALEQQLQVPVDDAIAGFYCAGEVISIMENAARAGLPVPQALKDILVKLNPSADIEPRLKQG